jgi:hypothetical protein
MITRRLLILTRLAALASTITKANGYDTDAGLKVYIGGAPELGPDDPDYAIAIVPGDELATEDGRISNSFPVAVQSIGKLSAGVMKRGPTRTLERPPGSTTIGLEVFYTCPYLDEWGNPSYGVPAEAT